MSKFSLYSVEFRSKSPNLLEMAENFLDDAEVDFYDRSRNIVRVRVVSSLTEEELRALCDDYKKECELAGNARLIYKVTSVML